MIDGGRHWWWQRPFLYIGRMAEDKGVAEILKAWLELKSRFPRDCPPLWLAGGSPEEIEAMRDMVGWNEPIIDFERRGEVIWWGYLDAAGLSALLCRVGVVVMHSRYEPGGRVVLEAMAQGVPVIATPHGFAAELVEDWKSGFLVEFGAHDDLVARMAHFIRQPLLRNVLGADAKQAAAQALEEWDFMGAHRRVYDSVVAGRMLEVNVKRPRPSVQQRSHYRQRRVLPTYQVDDQPPSIADIVAMVEAATQENVQVVEPITEGVGSSLRWRVHTSGVSWVVKWPYPRLNKSILWNGFSHDRLLTMAHTRFQKEHRSGTLPGFVPWDATDPERLLLMRRERELVRTFDPDTVAAAASVYRELGQAPFSDPGLAGVLKNEWHRAGCDDLLATKDEIRRLLAQDAWNTEALFSLRMAWRMMELDLRYGKIPRSLSMPNELLEGLHRFVSLAESEQALPVTITHGGGDPMHCLWTGERTLGLIDGERIHPALAGEDLAALLYFIVENNALTGYDRHSWPTMLEAAAGDDDEWDRLVSWMGYLAFDQLREAITIVDRDRFASGLESVNALLKLAEQRLSR